MTKKHNTAFSEIKRQALADPVARDAYNESQKTWKLRELLISSRETAGLSQTELAARLNLPASNISRIEKSPDCANIKTIFKYLDACNVDIDFVPHNQNL